MTVIPLLARATESNYLANNSKDFKWWYELGGKELPHFYPWVQQVFNHDLMQRAAPTPPPRPQDVPSSRLQKHQREELASICEVSTDHMDRLIRSHGQTLHEVAALRLPDCKGSRLPDAVVWPSGHTDAERIVQTAARLQLALVPLGGATSVSCALNIPEDESRPVVVVDTTGMNSILWIDEESLVACCQSGVVGQDLERELRARGFTVGHEPDSYEFSTLGGWVATRASGMKKNRYGNIEDVVIGARMVTPKGTLQRAPPTAPRISAGPDHQQVTLGSEGTLGIITEVLVKLRPKPTVTRYGSLVFPCLKNGLECLREVAKRRIQPASIRLMDNEQFKFGQALKTEKTYGGVILDGLKKFYLTKIKGFDVSQMAVATLLFEGTEAEVNLNQKEIEDIAKKCGGIPAGAENGRAGYTLTFVIAYIRDLALEFGIVAESFETSVSWGRALSLCERVKTRLAVACHSRGIPHFLASCRITQTYDSGCCIYFYFAFNATKCKDAIHTYDEIEKEARDEVILAGGSVSHHHGVGKLRQRWYERTVSEPGLRVLRAAKYALDPDNIFALGNISKDISVPLNVDIPRSRL